MALALAGLRCDGPDNSNQELPPAVGLDCFSKWERFGYAQQDDQNPAIRAELINRHAKSKAVLSLSTLTA